jgi:hypothetical protein
LSPGTFLNTISEQEDNFCILEWLVIGKIPIRVRLLMIIFDEVVVNITRANLPGIILISPTGPVD